MTRDIGLTPPQIVMYFILIFIDHIKRKDITL